jgi:hypothetical protein
MQTASKILLRLWYDCPSQAWWSGDASYSRFTPDMYHRLPGENRLQDHCSFVVGENVAGTAHGSPLPGQGEGKQRHALAYAFAVS